MIANAFFASTILFLALGFYLLQECQFLIPYRSLLIQEYGGRIFVFSAVLFLNLFALVCLVGRKLLLKDTGRKLAHLEKQLRSGPSLSEELTRRLDD